MTLLLCRAPLCVRHKTEPFVFFFIFSFSFPLPRFYWINFTHLRWWCWNWMSKAALLRLPLAENPICIDVCLLFRYSSRQSARVRYCARPSCSNDCSLLLRWFCIQALSSQQRLLWDLLMKLQHYWRVSDIGYFMNWKHFILSWVSFKRSTTGRYKHLWGLLCVSSVVVEQDDSIGP